MYASPLDRKILNRHQLSPDVCNHQPTSQPTSQPTHQPTNLDSHLSQVRMLGDSAAVIAYTRLVQHLNSAGAPVTDRCACLLWRHGQVRLPVASRIGALACCGVTARCDCLWRVACSGVCLVLACSALSSVVLCAVLEGIIASSVVSCAVHQCLKVLLCAVLCRVQCLKVLL